MQHVKKNTEQQEAFYTLVRVYIFGKQFWH